MPLCVVPCSCEIRHGVLCNDLDSLNVDGRMDMIFADADEESIALSAVVDPSSISRVFLI